MRKNEVLCQFPMGIGGWVGLTWQSNTVQYTNMWKKKVPFWQLIPHAMVSLSKPMWSSPEETLSAKRKRVLNSKLASKDNVHQDAVKQRKLHTTHPKTNNPFHSSTQNSKSSTTSKQHSSSRQVSVEEADNEIDITAATGTPKIQILFLMTATVKLNMLVELHKILFSHWLQTMKKVKKTMMEATTQKRMTHKSLKKSCRRKQMSRSLVN